MSVEYVYLADGFYSIEQIKQLCLKLPDVTSEEIRSSISESLQVLNLKYNKLPAEFLDLSEIRVQGIAITGLYPSDLDMVPYFTTLVNSLSSVIGPVGSFDISAYFEEKQSKQEKDYSDRVFIRYAKGKYYFCYTSNGSKVDLDDAYRLSVFKEMVRVAELPILIKREKDGFSLEHAQGAELEVGGTWSGNNPTEFNCELPGVTGELAVKNMSRILSEFSSGTIYSYEWDLSAYTSELDSDMSDACKKLYDIAVVNCSSADKYKINLEFYIQGLTGLENVRKWCADKDSLYSTVCYFTFDDGAAGNFVVLGSNKGYEIKLMFNQPVEIEKIESLLEMKFKEDL